MRSVEIGGVGEPREPVRLYDEAAYELVPGSTPSRRDIFETFTTEFTKFVANAAVQSEDAARLLSSVQRYEQEGGDVSMLISCWSEIDWSDGRLMQSVPEVFDVLKGLNNVLNDPPRHVKEAARDFCLNNGGRDGEAPLAQFVRYAFQDPDLGVSHAYYWERCIHTYLAPRYVYERSVEPPDQVQELYAYAHTITVAARARVLAGSDTRADGVEQLIGQTINSLAVLEDGDPRYTYNKRIEVAHTVANLVDDPERMLSTLGKYLTPCGIDTKHITGALFKPVYIRDSSGTVLFKDWQRFDSFWFNPIDSVDEGVVPGFPNTPLLLPRQYGLDYDDRPFEHQRATDYSDPSYFRPDGSKVYWGDLSNGDVAKIHGAYYCVGQSDSFHNVPEWAVTFADFAANEDPHRPVESFVNTVEGQNALPDNPLLLHPDYVRAVAVGAIIDGRFVVNKREARFDFIPPEDNQS